MTSGEDKIVLIDDASNGKVKYIHNYSSRVKSSQQLLICSILAPHQDSQYRPSIEKECFEEKHDRSPARLQVLRF